MRYYVYTTAGALMEVQRNHLHPAEEVAAGLAERVPTAIYFEVAP